MPLIATLFHHGAFTVHDVLMTRNALVAYSIGLLGMILVKVRGQFGPRDLHAHIQPDFLIDFQRAMQKREPDFSAPVSGCRVSFSLALA